MPILPFIFTSQAARPATVSAQLAQIAGSTTLQLTIVPSAKVELRYG
jgi:hypothetical protein